MALDPAGISLEAQGFRAYIRNLDTIEERQRAVFDTEFDGTSRSFTEVTRLAERFARAQREAADEAENLAEAEREAADEAGNLAIEFGKGLGITFITNLTDAILTLGATAASVFVDMVKEGIELNKQFELTEKVFTNVFGDPNLGKATVDFLNETADSLRLNRKEAAQFAQVVLPKTGGLDEFTELLRLTDIQADSTGKTLGELTFSIQNALAGQFDSLKDQFDLDPTQIARIQELTPALGSAAAIAKVVGEEFARLGKTDISGTLATNIKDLESQFVNLQAIVGKPTFDVLKTQTDNLLQSLERNEEGIKRTAIALGEVTGNIIELVSTEIVSFIDSLDFTAIEKGVDNLNAFVEALRVVGVTIKEAFDTGIIQTAFGLLTGNTTQLLEGFNKIKEADFGQSFQNITDAADKGVKSQEDYKNRVNETANAQSSFTDESKAAIDAFLSQSAAQNQAGQSLDGYANSLKEAEKLQLSFSKAAEDTALKLVRSNEDIARKQEQSVNKLGEKQAKDRDKLLKNQVKQFDKFESDRRKQITKAESNIEKARKEASDKRKRDQKKLQSELRQAQEKFNLSQLQSERRFSLSESRLRAEGDILALQQLREDRELERQEDKENFDVSQKDRVKSAEETQKEQAKDLDAQIKKLKTNLEDQRAELLTSFDEQLAAQVEAQAQAQVAQQVGFQEQAAERAIQLTREEEDRRISQGRQLENLGRSLAEQQDVTEEGATAIAGELEKVFGLEGTADNIITGFTAKTENEFTELFKNLEKIVSEAEIEPKPLGEMGTSSRRSTMGTSRRIGGIQEFQEGGIVPGPVGSPQIIQAHGGETVLPTQQRSFVMAAPVIPSQVLTVEGGMDIKGSGFGENNEQIIQMTMAEMSEAFRIAVQRLARRN